MYYGLIILSTIMFGGSFLLNDIYRKQKGSGFFESLQYSFYSSLAGAVILLIVNGFKFQCTPFTLIMAILNFLNGLCFTYSSFKSLGKINLSVYSLYSMLGGMLLPFIQGILFYGEALTLSKILCLIFIWAALILTVKKGKGTGGFIYYAGIFIFNGMSGVISKIYASSTFPKADAASYSVLCAVCSAIGAALMLTFIFRDRTHKFTLTTESFSVSVGHGAINRIANLILIVALAHVDTSVQYPMVTGGVMIVSTVISILKGSVPSKKEILSVVLAFIGTLLLFII